MSKPAPAHKPKATPRIPEDQPLSAQEQEILAAMKAQFGDRLKTISESTLIRYIRGYKDDPHPKEKAIEMLGKMLTWRESNKIDELVKQTLPKGDVFKHIWPSGVHGVGKEGHPILVNRLGAVDGSKLTKEFTMDQVTQFHIQEMESLNSAKEAASSLQQRRIYKHIAILDLKGLSMSHLSEKFRGPMKQFVSIDQDFYPETLHVMIIVNSGMIMKAAWKIASHWIDPITKERIKFGNQYLTEYIDAANIPAIYHGHCGCAGGKCLETPFIPGKDANAAVVLPPASKEAVDPAAPAAAGEGGGAAGSAGAEEEEVVPIDD